MEEIKNILPNGFHYFKPVNPKETEKRQFQAQEDSLLPERAADRLILSEESEKLSRNANPDQKSEKSKESDESAQPGQEKLDEKEKKEVENLEKRDQAVRAHEQAHLSAGSGLVRGGASFKYETGPDGKQYAVSGEVKIDISEAKGDPQATITKMQRVRRAALAPADPSGQDRSVAARASAIEAKARQELASQHFGNSNQSPIEKYSQSENQAKESGNLIDITERAAKTTVSLEERPPTKHKKQVHH